MAEWRKKAYEAFGFEPGRYSGAHGKVELFDDLREMARSAARAGDAELLDKIFEYARWADQQNAENLRSAADIAFFIPMFEDAQLLGESEIRLPAALIESKRRLAASGDQA